MLFSWFPKSHKIRSEVMVYSLIIYISINYSYNYVIVVSLGLCGLDTVKSIADIGYLM